MASMRQRTNNDNSITMDINIMQSNSNSSSNNGDQRHFAMRDAQIPVTLGPFYSDENANESRE